MFEAPIAFEDIIYSSFFKVLILVLRTLAYEGHMAIPTANIAELIPGPIAAFIDNARINDGKERKTSVSHINMLSMIPEKYPDMAPTINPINNAIEITEKNLGIIQDDSYIVPIIMDFFSRNYSANFVAANTADLIIERNISFSFIMET